VTISPAHTLLGLQVPGDTPVGILTNGGPQEATGIVAQLFKGRDPAGMGVAWLAQDELWRLAASCLFVLAEGGQAHELKQRLRELMARDFQIVGEA